MEMDPKKKKKLYATIGSVLIGAGVIWGAVGFKLIHLPFLIILVAVGCVFSYMSKKIQV